MGGTGSGGQNRILLNADEIWRLYEQGFTCREMIQYGFVDVKSVSTVTKTLKNAGYKIPSNQDRQTKDRYSEETLKWCREMYMNGVGLERLCEYSFGTLGSITLRRIFRERGWMLSRSEFNKRFMSGENHGAYKFRKKLLENGVVRMTSMNGFRSCVAYISNMIARQFKIRKKGYALDHQYSLHAAYYNTGRLKRRITVKEICHPANLRSITIAENSAKRAKCSISATELRKRIKEWNKKFGDPFLHRNYVDYNFERWDS